MIRFAIVGNIASGKSQVENILLDLGYKVFDTDKIAHSVLDEYSNTIISSFEGYDIKENGKISRQKLGNLVFDNQILKEKLESIVHPLVKNAILDLFEQYKNERYVFISIPLLYEARMDDLFDKVIFVSCDDKIRLKRLMNRNSLNKSDALKRINAQIPQEEKILKADYIIKNESTLSNLRDEVLKLF